MSFAVSGSVIGGALITANSQPGAPGPPQFAEQVQPLVDQTVGNLATGGIAGQPIQQFEGDRVADLTALQQQGIGQTQGLATALQGQAGTAAQGFQTFAGGSQVGQNPFLEQAIQAMQQSGNQNLARNQLPLVRNTAVASGGLGGSRQGIAEGLAISDLNQQLVNTEAGMRTQQFQQDQTNQLNALIQQGNILGGQGLSQQALLQGGGIQQQQAQAEIGGEMQLFNEQQQQEFDRQQQLLQILMGAPAATPQLPNQQSPLAAGLGTGIIASQLFGGSNPTNPLVGQNTLTAPPGGIGRPL